MDLTTCRAIVLGEDDFQELELWYPVLRFREEGAEVDIIAPDSHGNYRSALGYPLLPNGGPADAGTADVVVIPGGGAAKRLRDEAAMTELVAAVHGRGGVVGAVGDGRDVVTASGVDAAAERVVCVGDANELPQLMNGIWAALEGRQA